MKTSFNNRLILEPYIKSGGLNAKERNGFAMIEQKVTLKGLKVLVDAKISFPAYSVEIPRGSIAYIKEETLHTSAWAQKFLESVELESKFIIVDFNHVEFVDLNPEQKLDA